MENAPKLLKTTFHRAGVHGRTARKYAKTSQSILRRAFWINVAAPRYFVARVCSTSSQVWTGFEMLFGPSYCFWPKLAYSPGAAKAAAARAWAPLVGGRPVGRLGRGKDEAIAEALEHLARARAPGLHASGGRPGRMQRGVADPLPRSCGITRCSGRRARAAQCQARSDPAERLSARTPPHPFFVRETTPSSTPTPDPPSRPREIGPREMGPERSAPGRQPQRPTMGRAARAAPPPRSGSTPHWATTFVLLRHGAPRRECRPISAQVCLRKRPNLGWLRAVLSRSGRGAPPNAAPIDRRPDTHAARARTKRVWGLHLGP